uniref:Tal-like protein 3A n=1 Tax=Anopheles gambiae TaxID=7165 RepID=A3RLR8_ANOGA|nr:tal-like protein 3A [Anopheles gambiae]
MARKLDPTGHY